MILNDQQNLEIKNYIVNNAERFDFTVLFTILNKMGYSLSDIAFIPSLSLSSQNAYIKEIEFLHNNKVNLLVNNTEISLFIDEIRHKCNANIIVENFFCMLCSKLLEEYFRSIYLEGESKYSKVYDHGNSLINLHDCNIKSYSFIYSFIERMFSEYLLSIHSSNEPVDSESLSGELGVSLLDGNCVLGEKSEVFKKFIIVRFITEKILEEFELNSIYERIGLIMNFFKDVTEELNLIVENQITDESTYSVLSIELKKNTQLVQNVVRFKHYITIGA